MRSISGRDASSSAGSVQFPIVLEEDLGSVAVKVSTVRNIPSDAHNEVDLELVKQQVSGTSNAHRMSRTLSGEERPDDHSTNGSLPGPYIKIGSVSSRDRHREQISRPSAIAHQEREMYHMSPPSIPGTGVNVPADLSFVPSILNPKGRGICVTCGLLLGGITGMEGQPFLCPDCRITQFSVQQDEFVKSYNQTSAKETHEPKNNEANAEVKVFPRSKIDSDKVRSAKSTRILSIDLDSDQFTNGRQGPSRDLCQALVSTNSETSLDNEKARVIKRKLFLNTPVREGSEVTADISSQKRLCAPSSSPFSGVTSNTLQSPNQHQRAPTFRNSELYTYYLNNILVELESDRAKESNVLSRVEVYLLRLQQGTSSLEEQHDIVHVIHGLLTQMSLLCGSPTTSRVPYLCYLELKSKLNLTEFTPRWVNVTDLYKRFVYI